MKKLFRARRVYFLMLSLGSIILINTCDGQSVVGKWKRDLSHMFSVDKTTGEIVNVSPDVQKQYNEAYKENGYQEILEMKADNTYISTVSAGGKQTVHSGVYTVVGKTLEMNIAEVQGSKTTITILKLTNSSMLWNLVFKGRSTGIDYEKM